MFKPVSVKARPDWHLWIRYQDGSEGEIDLSGLVGRGVFVQLEDKELFQRVYIDDDEAIRWNNDLELCPDALYLKLTGQKPGGVFPKLNPATHA